MQSLNMFIGAIIFICFSILAYHFKTLKNARHFLKLNPKIARGIYIAVSIIFLSVIFIESSIAKSLKKSGFSPDVFVFFGVENTRHRSPMCDLTPEVNDKLTANIGFGWTAYRSNDHMFEITVPIRHNSCVLNDDYWRKNSIGIDAVKYFNF